jgi:hypothetical protein
MQGDIKSQNLPAIVGQDDHYIQQPKRCASHDKHLDPGDTLGLIEQEATSGRWRRAAFSGHVLGDRAMADLDAQLEELAMDPGRPPKRVGDVPLPNQIPNFVIH